MWIVGLGLTCLLYYQEIKARSHVSNYILSEAKEDNGMKVVDLDAPACCTLMNIKQNHISSDCICLNQKKDAALLT